MTEDTGEKKTATRKTTKAPAKKKAVESAADSIKKPKVTAKKAATEKIPAKRAVKKAETVAAAPEKNPEKNPAVRKAKKPAEQSDIQPAGQPEKAPAAKKTRKSKKADVPVTDVPAAAEEKAAKSARPSRKKSAATQADTEQSVPVAVPPAAVEPGIPAVEAASADAAAGQSETGEKKRRSRSRRGRGRKKSMQTAGAEHQAAEQEQDGKAELPIVFLDLPEALSGADENEGGKAQGKDGSAHKDSEAKGKAPRRKMFVSVLPEEQIEVVITEEAQVQEYYVEMLHQAKTKGNIYKGIVHNVDPNLQAAFVSYGAVKNGFPRSTRCIPSIMCLRTMPARAASTPRSRRCLSPGRSCWCRSSKNLLAPRAHS